nr:MAG TPA: hypothetical protein [Caudoviricetes sp.]
MIKWNFQEISQSGNRLAFSIYLLANVIRQ